MAKPTLTIPVSLYIPGQAVWLLYGGAMIPTSIKVRHYDPDRRAWFYRVAMSGQWHTAEELSDRPVTDGEEIPA